jgi:hypothetical protein
MDTPLEVMTISVTTGLKARSPPAALRATPPGRFVRSTLLSASSGYFPFRLSQLPGVF